MPPAPYVVSDIAKQLRYVMRRRPWPIEFPRVVQFPVNDICDSKCQMCNIWQQKRGHEITPEEVRQVFSGPLFARVRTVGLNGGEPTLRKDLATIATALIDSLPQLRALSLITNGLRADRAIERIDELIGVCATRGVRLDVMVSLDGVGSVHDRVRGVQGNFNHAVRVLDYLRTRPDLCSTRVGCTVVRENVYDLHELLEFCIAREVYCKFRLGVPNRRLYNLPPVPSRTIGKRTWLDKHPFDLDDEQRWHLAQFLRGVCLYYEAAAEQRRFYESLADQVVYGMPRRAGCDWQHRGVTVSSRGEILYCAVQSKVLGDGVGGDAQRIYFDNEQYLREIVNTKCSTCAHDYVGPPGGLRQLDHLAQRLLTRVVPPARRSAFAEAGRAVRRLGQTTLGPARFRLLRRGYARAAAVVQRRGGAEFDALICGWYGTETLGDKAILASIVTSMRATMPDARIAIASLNPTYTRLTTVQMPELQRCEVLDVRRAHELIHRVGVLVFGGGPLMAIREIALMESLFTRARAAGTPGIVAGCGVGPLGGRAFNESIAGLLASASYRIFRDEQSKLLAEATLSIDTRDDQVAEDPAAAWVRANRRGPGNRTNERILALGLRDWPYRQYAPALGERNARRIVARMEHAVTVALESLISGQPDLRILPIPFCTHEAGGDDRWLYWRLVRSSSLLAGATDRSLMSREQSPVEYLRRLCEASAILAMRFHSLVFAANAAVPAVAIDYTGGVGKTTALGRRVASSMLPVEALSADELAVALTNALNTTQAADAGLADFHTAFTEAWSACLDRSRHLRVPKP